MMSVETAQLPSKTPGEFRTGWPLLLGATAAVSTGVAFFNYTAGFFIRSIQDDMGWSRAEIALGATIGMIVTAALLPLAGYLTDRLGPLRVGVAGLGGYGLMCLALAAIHGDLGIYYGVLAVLAILCSGTSAVTFAPLIAGHFILKRGFAMGILMSGPAILLVPLSPVLTNIIAANGWRTGYLALGGGALLVGLPGLLLAARGAGKRAAARGGAASGMGFADAVRTATYWKLVSGTLFSTLALGGFMNQYAPLLADKGFAATRIGLLGSIFVTMILVGRILFGYLLDRFNAPVVSLFAMAAAAGGALLFLLAEPSFMSAAIFLALIGCAFGAEGDIAAFFSARAFGLGSFSTIFSTLAMTVAVGSGLGALLFGRLQDAQGSYAGALHLAVGLLIAAALLFGSLPRGAMYGREDQAR